MAKMENMLVEYNYLLSSQLEKQRAFCEEQLRCVYASKKDQIDALEKKVGECLADIRRVTDKQAEHRENTQRYHAESIELEKKVGGQEREDREEKESRSAGRGHNMKNCTCTFSILLYLCVGSGDARRSREANVDPEGYALRVE